MPEIQSLADFLKNTAAAQPEALLAELLRRAEVLGVEEFNASAELARMKSYIATYYDGVRPVSSFAERDGHVVDCVPFDQHPAARSARKAGQELMTTAAPPALLPGGEHQAKADPSLASKCPCPAGTVPIRRITLDHLVSFGNLDNYFHKTARPSD